MSDTPNIRASVTNRGTRLIGSPTWFPGYCSKALSTESRGRHFLHLFIQVNTAQSQPLLLRMGHVFLYDRRAVRPGRPGKHLRTGHDPLVSPDNSTLLVYSGLAGSGGAHIRNAGAGRFLSLGAGGVW